LQHFGSFELYNNVLILNYNFRRFSIQHFNKKINRKQYFYSSIFTRC